MTILNPIHAYAARYYAMPYARRGATAPRARYAPGACLPPPSARGAMPLLYLLQLAAPADFRAAAATYAMLMLPLLILLP